MATAPASRADAIEAEITKRIAAAGVRLRFDRVALRLLHEVKTHVGERVPAGQCILFTVTAPIKLPAKTSSALQEWLRPLRSGEMSTTLNGNKVRARIVPGVPSGMLRAMGFVHNPESDAERLLEIAETGLRDSRRL